MQTKDNGTKGSRYDRGKAEQLAGFKRLNLKFRRLLGKIANGGKERKHIISRKTGDTFITVLVYI